MDGSVEERVEALEHVVGLALHLLAEADDKRLDELRTRLGESDTVGARLALRFVRRWTVV